MKPEELRMMMHMAEGMPMNLLATYIKSKAEAYLEKPTPENLAYLEYGCILLGMKQTAKDNGGAEKLADIAEKHKRLADILLGKTN